MSSGASIPKPRFLDGVADHYATFRNDQAGAQRIVATVLFVDREAVALEGLRIETLPGSPDCRMLRGSVGEAKLAVVVRDDHVLRVEFEADPVPKQGFGF